MIHITWTSETRLIGTVCFNWFQVMFLHKVLKFSAESVACSVSSAQQYHRNPLRCKLKVSEMQQYNSFRLNLITGHYCPLQIWPLWSKYSVPNTCPTTGRLSVTCISWRCPVLPVIQLHSAWQHSIFNPLIGFSSLGREGSHKGLGWGSKKVEDQFLLKTCWTKPRWLAHCHDRVASPKCYTCLGVVSSHPSPSNSLGPLSKSTDSQFGLGERTPC